MNRTAFALGLLLGILGQSAVHAERLTVGAAEQVDSDSLVAPTRGANMDEVKRRFGRPARIFPAVGEPPITRWVYPELIVYFEGNRVIHSVEAVARYNGGTPRQNSARNP